MRVLQVIPSLSPQLGGPTRAVQGFSEGLQQLGVDVQILTTDDDTSRRLEVPLQQLTLYKGIPTMFLPRTLRAKEFIYTNALDRWQSKHLRSFDLVHTHYLFSYLPSWTARAARQRDIPYLMRPLGQLTPWALSQSPFKKKLYSSLLEHRNLQKAAAIHCTSQEESKNVRELGFKTPTVPLPLGVKRSVVIPKAKAKLRQTYSIPAEIPVVLFLSRLHHKKQPEVLLQAVKQLLKRQPCHVIFAGTGELAYIETLRSLTAELGIKNHVTFAGFVDGYEKDLLLQGSDVFALPSHSENFGIAVAEALVSKLPVVITPGIQISAEIKAAEAGLVVEAEAEAFCDAIHRILTQQKLQYTLKKNGLRLSLSRYEWGAIAEELLAVYENILINKSLDQLTVA